MKHRHVLAPLLLFALAATAGCVGIFGPSPVDQAGLAEDEEYEWNTSRAGYIEVHESNYTAVYTVANRTTGNLNSEDGNYTIELYTRDALGTEQPMQFTALQFRYPNGTTVRYTETAGGQEDAQVVRVHPNGTEEPAPGALYVDRTRKRTIVHLPANDTGKLAFTVSKNGKSIATPTFVEGSYEMVLPEQARIGVPLLAQVRPQRDNVRITDGHRRLIWNDLEAPSLNVRYYLARDLLIFASIVGVMIVVGIGGAAYYLIQIRRTVQKREEVGLDVEVPDDDRDGPPPGMR